VIPSQWHILSVVRLESRHPCAAHCRDVVEELRRRRISDKAKPSPTAGETRHSETRVRSNYPDLFVPAPSLLLGAS